MTEHGPLYNVTSAGLAKHRNLARDGLASLTWEQRQAYGSAVEAAVLSAQRREAMRALPAMPRPNCASGTWHSDGADIHAAIRQQQRNALLNCPGVIRRARTPDQWRELYEQAMDAKAKRIADELWEQAA